MAIYIFLFSGSFVEVLPSSTSRMVPSILQGAYPRGLYFWWDFCDVVWFRVFFIFLLRCSFLIFFSFISDYLMVSAFRTPKYLEVFFSLSVLIFPWFGSFLPSIICRFPIFIIRMKYYPMPNSIPISSLDILTLCIRVTNSFSFFAKSLISSKYIFWLMFLAIIETLSACAFPKYMIEWPHRSNKY